ncbi:hypothetical protein B0H17DRAFT_1050021 [Mycena rosella]|uniref:Uncharacterized protein n=1 Tax=Mycena rosella TaxID=1033263 RepID=A0AAD7GKK6_MYCRO|nr:hypothetical protein B0H17DRAFT_1050021 [Mycena rosella]
MLRVLPSAAHILHPMAPEARLFLARSHPLPADSAGPLNVDSLPCPSQSHARATPNSTTCHLKLALHPEFARDRRLAREE